MKEDLKVTHAPRECGTVKTATLTTAVNAEKNTL